MLNSSPERSELSQWLCSGDSTINIVTDITVIIILTLHQADTALLDMHQYKCHAADDFSPLLYSVSANNMVS